MENELNQVHKTMRIYHGWPNCELHAKVRRAAWDFLSFPKNYIFVFYFYCKVQKYCKVVLL